MKKGDAMIMDLVKQDDLVLRTPTRDYDDAEIEDLGSTIKDMFDTLARYNGVGLAAPQVGIDRSMFVISIENIDKVFINPAVLSSSDTTIVAEEGCLSMPGLRLKVTRPDKVSVTWIAENGQRQIADLEGLWARAWLHEYDHLQGVMIDDRVSKLTLDMARRKLQKKIKRYTVSREVSR